MFKQSMYEFCFGTSRHWMFCGVVLSTSIGYAPCDCLGSNCSTTAVHNMGRNHLGGERLL
jgi:hypothetical protein